MTDDQLPLPMELIELDVAPAPISLAQAELQNAAYERAALLVLETKVTGPAGQVEMVRQLLLALAAEIRGLKI